MKNTLQEIQQVEFNFLRTLHSLAYRMNNGNLIDEEMCEEVDI